jgi:hypothetical protein
MKLLDLDLGEAGFNKIYHFVENAGVILSGLIPGPSPFYGEGCLI